MWGRGFLAFISVTTRFGVSRVTYRIYQRHSLNSSKLIQNVDDPVLGTIYFFPNLMMNLPHSLEVEEGECEDPNADPRNAPHLRQVPPHLEVLAHHDAAGVPHSSAAHGE